MYLQLRTVFGNVNRLPVDKLMCFNLSDFFMFFFYHEPDSMKYELRDLVK